MLTQCLTLALLVGAAPQTSQTKPQDKTTKMPASQQKHDAMDEHDSMHGEDPMESGRYHATRYTDLESIKGADVKLMADYEERAEAAEDGERAEGPTASIDDLLVDHENGRIVGAVVSVGGFLGIGDKHVAIPYDALRWNATDECFDLSATKEELKSLTAFDEDRAKKEGVERMMLQSPRAVESSARKDGSMHGHEGSKEMAGHDRKDAHGHASKDHGDHSMVVGDKRFSRVSNGLCLASKMEGKDVWARDQEFGEVSRMIVDRQTGKIDFVVLSHGGVAGMGDEKIIVPYDALSYCRADDGEAMAAGHDDPAMDDRLDDEKDGERVLCIRRTVADLQSSVRYEEPDEGVIDEETLRRARERADGRG